MQIFSETIGIQEVIDFWKQYNQMLLQAKKYGFMTNNILGEYTERLCISAFNLKPVTNNNIGYDATDEFGKRVQIKGRRITKGNVAKLTTLWNLEFDYIIAVIFDDQGALKFAQRISLEAVVRDTPFVTKKNCWRVIANRSNSGKNGYVDITDLFNSRLSILNRYH